MSTGPAGHAHTARTAPRWGVPHWQLHGLLLLGVVCLAVLHLRTGAYTMTTATLLDVLRGSADAEQAFIVTELRLPRVLVALLVGSVLGYAGSFLQAMLRNPLADASIVGVSAGAGFAVVLLASIGGASVQRWQGLAAFGGGTVAAVVVAVCAGQRGNVPLRQLLAGIGVTATLHAGTTLLTTYGDIWDTHRALVWMSGSLALVGWGDVTGLLVWIIVCVPVILLQQRAIQLLGLGDAVAQGLGVAVQRQRLLVLAATVALVCATVSVCGIVGFVGLFAPVSARRFVGDAVAAHSPIAAWIGAGLVLAADTVGRVILPPLEIPAGLMTTIIGTPMLLWLVLRHSKGGV